MTNAGFDAIEDYRDIETLNIYRERINEKGQNKKTVMKAIKKKAVTMLGLHSNGILM